MGGGICKGTDMDRKRYEKLDGIRGIALLNMIVYHAAWDLVYMYHTDWDWYRTRGAYVWQQGICWTFIFLSGFCWPLGRHVWRRGVTVFAGGALITLVTVVVMPQNRVIFGVLTLIGSCMLFMNVFDRWLVRVQPAVGMAVSWLLFFLTRNVNEGYLGFGAWRLCRIPVAWYQNVFTAYLGFPGRDFYSTDYFSVLPWLFLFAAGYFVFRFCSGKKVMAYLEKGLLRPVEWLGRHSLFIYMIHQPLIYGLFEVIFRVREG